MLRRIVELNPTKAEHEVAVAEQWIAADLERGAYLVRYSKPLVVAGVFYSPWFKLMFPAGPWAGGTLSDLQANTGLYHWRAILDNDIDAAVSTAEKKLAEWFAEAREGNRD